MSDNVLSLLEHIDDDAINYEHPIKLVRIDDDEEAKERGFFDITYYLTDPLGTGMLQCLTLRKAWSGCGLHSTGQ